MSLSPAQILAEVISTQLPNLGYIVYVGHMPDTPDKAIRVLQQTGGKLELRRMRTGVVDEHPALQVLVRAPTEEDAMGTMQQIAAMVDGVYQLTMSGGEKLQCITKTNTIGSLGQEQQTRRCFCSQSYRLTFTR
jgi:hypothetical protein